MVKFWVVFALIVAAVASLSHCDGLVASSPFDFGFNVGHASGERGSGVARSETRNIGDFQRIHVSGSETLVVEVVPGAAGGTLEVSADDNLLAFIQTEVRDGTLEIGPTASISTGSAIRVRVAIAALEGVHLEGANKLNLKIDSAKPFELHIEGAGRVIATGKVPAFTVHSEGAGTIDAQDLVAGTVDVHIEGAGRAKVHAAEVLRAHIEGAGMVTYKGEPKTVEKNIEGVGRISRAD
ncbi:MAG: DUF2807 domain-containing protein [Betaproteobacteria bacterium]